MSEESIDELFVRDWREIVGAKGAMAMPAMIEIGSLISKETNIRGGRPVITGTGVTVKRIVGWYQLGLSPDEIATEIPHLSLAQVFAALTYYHANREEIEADLAAERAEAEKLEQIQRLVGSPS